MSVNVLVPPLSQTMDTLVIVEWLKKIGDPVTKGEILFTVETDKATLEVESPATGILSSVLAGAGDEVKVRSIIGIIAEPGEAFEEALTSVDNSLNENYPPGPGAPPSTDRQQTINVTGPKGEPLPPERINRLFASPRARQLAQLKGIPLVELRGSGTGPRQLIVERDVSAYIERQKARPRVTPVARRMAEMTGVDLSKVVPAKPGTAITKADVETSLHEGSGAPASAQSSFQAIRLTPTRKTIARRMHESHQITAPVTYMREVDATRLVKLRERILEKLSEDAIRPTYTDFLVYITCRVLSKHPALNAYFDGETVELHDAVHMALAVDTARGLMAPVIRDADSKGVEELARIRGDLIDRTLKGTVTPNELAGGTFTLTNLGALGIDHFTPILNPPQVAILGVGRIREIPAVHKGKIRIRSVMGLSLTCDHRVIDGAPAARFLLDICNLIESPDLVWL